MSDKQKTLVLISLIVMPFWMNSLIRFMDCDFAAPYQCEIVNGIGIVTYYLSLLTTFINY